MVQPDSSYVVEDVFDDEELTLQSDVDAGVNVSSTHSAAPALHNTPTRRLTLSMNEAQAQAVTHPLDARLLILAGPGTGKTKTLISRVIYMLSLGVHPSNLIVTTFTVKAANEMRDRIAAMVGYSVASRLVLGTFHSIARRYLVKYGHILGLKSFAIADETDAMHFMKDIMQERDDEVTKQEIRSARHAISNCKSRSHVPPEWADIYAAYQQRLRAADMLDFDDLLLKCVQLLKAAPEIVSNVEAVLVDEFQDTNVVQYELMRLLASARNNITVVGDPDQSIYAFRAAESSNLSKMQLDYNTTIVSLEENYRSSAHILNAAMAVITQDKLRISKSVLPNHDSGIKPVFFSVQTANVEAKLISREIRRLIALSCGMLQPSDFAVLVRSARLTQPIESELTKSGIDYRMVGGFRFWEREEIKLLVNYLAVVNSRKSPVLLDILNAPKRGIGSTTQATLLNHANSYQISLWQAIEKATNGELKVTAKIQSSLSAFVSLINDLEEMYKTTDLPTVLEALIDRLDYRTVLQTNHKDTYVSRLENVNSLAAYVSTFSNTSPDPDLPDVGVPGADTTDDVLQRFLASVNLAPTEADAGVADPASLVTLSTIHGSKGLEWPVVFIPGVYDGSIPHARSTIADLNEERRLLYVAMTRAKALLYLSQPLILSRAAMFSQDDIKSRGSPFVANISHTFQTSFPALPPSSFVTLARILGREVPELEDLKKANQECEFGETGAGAWAGVDGEEDDEGSAHVLYPRRRTVSGEPVRPKRQRTTSATTIAALASFGSFVSGTAVQTMAFEINRSVKSVNAPFKPPSSVPKPEKLERVEKTKPEKPEPKGKALPTVSKTEKPKALPTVLKANPQAKTQAAQTSLTRFAKPRAGACFSQISRHRVALSDTIANTTKLQFVDLSSP